MSLSMVKKLNLGELTLTTLSLYMVDRSLTYPKGIIEDVLVKVDKFIFPVDFVVVEMEEYRDILIILGRSFLVAGQALIDVKNGELTLRVVDEEVKFNLTKTVRFGVDDKRTCMRVDSLIPSIGEMLHDMVQRDPLEECLIESLSMVDLEFDIHLQFRKCLRLSLL